MLIWQFDQQVLCQNSTLCEQLKNDTLKQWRQLKAKEGRNFILEHITMILLLEKQQA